MSKVCVFLKYFIILEFRTKIQLPAVFLSSVSKLNLLQYLYTTSRVTEGLFIKFLVCHCCCFIINNKNHNKWWVFRSREIIYTFSQIFLNIPTTDKTFQDSGNHKLKNSANMYETSGSLFFRTATGTQRKPETSE